MKKLITFIILTVAMAASASAQLLYRVSGGDLERPSYIFGTHHFAPKAFADSVGAFAYIDSVAGVVAEIDMVETDIMQMTLTMQKYMMAPADSTLSKVVADEKKMEEMAARFKEMSGGMDIRMCESLKPSATAQTLLSMLMMKIFPEFSKMEQLDATFQQMGKEKGLEITGLETPELQAEVLFCSKSLKAQADDLYKTLTDERDICAMVERLNAAYFSGNLEEMQRISNEDEDDPAFTQRLLTERNRRWMEQLPALMQAKPRMVVVGALHLAGEEGLPYRLQQLGYTVTPLWPKH